MQENCTMIRIFHQKTTIFYKIDLQDWEKRGDFTTIIIMLAGFSWTDVSKISKRIPTFILLRLTCVRNVQENYGVLRSKFTFVRGGGGEEREGVVSPSNRFPFSSSLGKRALGGVSLNLHESVAVDAKLRGRSPHLLLNRNRFTRCCCLDNYTRYIFVVVVAPISPHSPCFPNFQFSIRRARCNFP